MGLICETAMICQVYCIIYIILQPIPVWLCNFLAPHSKPPYQSHLLVTVIGELLTLDTSGLVEHTWVLMLQVVFLDPLLFRDLQLLEFWRNQIQLVGGKRRKLCTQAWRFFSYKWSWVSKLGAVNVFMINIFIQKRFSCSHALICRATSDCLIWRSEWKFLNHILNSNIY